MDVKYRYGLKVEVSESIWWIVVNGCKFDIVMYNILINCLCKEGRMEDVVGVLDEVVKKGLVLNNIIYVFLI